MFDVGFLEILVVGVVALVVLGPDKLPGTIRTVGLWVGRLKRSFNNIKSEIEKEVGADEIRRQLRNEAIMEKIKNTQKQVTSTVDSVKKEAAAVAGSVKPEGLDDLKKDFDSITGNAPATGSAEKPEPKAVESSAPETPSPEAEKPAATGTTAPPPAGQDSPPKNDDKA